MNICLQRTSPCSFSKTLLYESSSKSSIVFSNAWHSFIPAARGPIPTSPMDMLPLTPLQPGWEH
ncbi:hypothetical protein RHMOL_Rhmol04G0261700 [Rhododendron molle]|uniref:Uncharacterized protein n=1 Tax=Rhododendron molle TaxID=49168 RepID=A0ACC0P5T4_RHOML|nr:hypothetical protein RHMOL_Rhmol04G0261700 [Rhododendron molle]